MSGSRARVSPLSSKEASAREVSDCMGKKKRRGRACVRGGAGGGGQGTK